MDLCNPKLISGQKEDRWGLVPSKTAEKMQTPGSGRDQNSDKTSNNFFRSNAHRGATNRHNTRIQIYVRKNKKHKTTELVKYNLSNKGHIFLRKFFKIML